MTLTEAKKILKGITPASYWKCKRMGRTEDRTRILQVAKGYADVYGQHPDKTEEAHDILHAAAVYYKKGG